ncbi:unnamed protein product [Mytilus coruscus]|uniref:Uncharacterized protein n=1 Tax=Mytilus coruscus TaxID=42192 RepID=A0A6J8AX55_MYTCO|nr:unnamed protein product [Mytilus coruscus]
MCVAFICFHRGRTRQLIENSNIHSENQIKEENNSCYSLYESIDEGAIYDDNVLDDDSEYSEDKYCKPESENSTLNSENSGYLLPFTSMIPKNGRDNYCKPESESSTLNSENSGYLLPFTSMIPNHGRDEHPYCRYVKSSRGSSVSYLSDDIEKDLKHINPYEQLQTELNEQSKFEYTHLHAVHYLELVDIRTRQNNTKDWNSSFGGSKNYLRKFRKWYSNDNISDEHLLCITSNMSKGNTKILRFHSENQLTLTSDTNFEICITDTKNKG